MANVLVLLLAVVCSVTKVTPSRAQNQCSTTMGFWDQQRDDPTEYQLDREAHVSGVTECIARATSRHQALLFSQADGSCRMFVCQLGFSGCRKCRNAANTSLPVLMVRRLGVARRSCWRTFQHRVDESVDFYRNWSDYRSGFGQGENRNYWMGLEAIYRLTQAGDRRARWEASLWNSSWLWWENQVFALQGADLGYRATVGDQDSSRSSPNIRIDQGAASLFMNSQKFSTTDADQDSVPDGRCTAMFLGCWWYASCHCFNPNGVYYRPPVAFNLTGNLWATGLTINSLSSGYPLNHYYSMKTFECMVMDFL